MLELSTLLTAVLTGVFVWFLIAKLLNKNWENAPPGPTGLPIIGNMHQLAKGKGPLESLQEWEAKYDSVVGFHLGQYRVVLLSGYETIKEAYSMWDFSGRQLLKPFHAITGGEKRGLLLSEGQAWTEQRRFALRNLRDFGFGKKSMETVIQDDINELIDNFKESEGQPFVPHRKFSTAILKSLWSIITGEKFKYGDPKFQSVLDGLSSVVSAASVTGPIFFMPWIATVFPGWTGWKNFSTQVANTKKFISGYVQEHQKTFQNDNIRDYLDIYLKEISETTDPNSSFYRETGEKHMLIGTLNLFAAGSETTSNTLVWALLYLIQNPHVQEKLHKEISGVIGDSRLPSLEDRDSCLYTWAVMEEVFRMSSLIPLGIFHNTMNDVTYKGHFIPKDTLVMSNLYGVHYDKRIWGDPKQFRPERFLVESSDGKLRKNPDAHPVLPFSIGKRACLGEVLARNNFFLYLTSLVQKFKFEAVKNNLEIGSLPGFLRAPEDFELIVKER